MMLVYLLITWVALTYIDIDSIDKENSRPMVSDSKNLFHVYRNTSLHIEQTAPDSVSRFLFSSSFFFIFSAGLVFSIPSIVHVIVFEHWKYLATLNQEEFYPNLFVFFLVSYIFILAFIFAYTMGNTIQTVLGTTKEQTIYKIKK